FILRSVNHFCVDFEVCFRSLTCWKVQPQPILSLPEGAVRFSFHICWYLMESMIPCILTRCPGPLEEKQPHNIILHSGYEVLFCMAIFLSTPNPSLLFVAKKLFIWSHLTIQPTH